MRKHSAQLAVLLTAIALGLTSPPVRAADPDPSVQKFFDNLIGAIRSNDRDAFVANATDAVRNGTTPQVMTQLNSLLGTRLAKGLEATYLCRLKQRGHEVHLWKLTFKDGGDDVVVRVVVKDGKLAGFFLQ